MEHRVIDLGTPAHYLDWGGEGPPMVLVHGLGGSAINWMSVAPALARRHRVVALDLAGFGETPPVDGAASMRAQLALLDRFLAAVANGPATLVGNSMGGVLSMMEAAEVPARVARLVLAAPAQPTPRSGRIDLEVLAVFGMYIVPWVAPWYLKRRAARLGPEGMVREMMRLCCANPARIPSDVLAAHVAVTAQRAERMPWATSAFLDAARSLLNVLRKRSEFFAMAARIAAPTLIVQGARDRLVPLIATQELIRRRPDWTLEVIDDSGHVPMLEHAERFVELVERWLATSPSAARAIDPSHR